METKDLLTRSIEEISVKELSQLQSVITDNDTFYMSSIDDFSSIGEIQINFDD